MNKIIRLTTAILFSIFVSTSSIAAEGNYGGASIKASSNPGSPISMDFQDANLKTVLKIFSQQSGLNFVASQNVQDRTVTIYFDNVTVGDALNHIMSANNLLYEQKPGSNIFIVKESGKAAIETITKIYELRYAQLSAPPTEGGKGSGDEESTSNTPEIVSIIERLLSENGKVVANKRSNSLIIMDVPSQFAVIEDVLAKLDVRTPQVMIEAEIIETTTTVADKLGVNWSGYFGTYTGPVTNTLWPLRGVLKQGSTTDPIKGITTAGSVSINNMTATLRALLSDTDTKILARPKVLTLNNEKALIEVTAETAVASLTTTSGSGGAETTQVSAERIDTGITLEVTPQINKDGYITMHIEPTVVVPVLSTFFQSETQKYVDPQRRSTNTTVMVKDGETIVIGGLISKEDSFVFNKVPFLGDLPILGAVFRYKTKDEVDKELLVFITPHIVREAEYAALGNISEREQESPKAVREKKIRTILDILGGENNKN